MEQLIAAIVAFVGTHFLLSHPLRAPIVGRIGERGFLGVYSLVAAITLGWLASAYRHAPATGFLWPVGDTLWAIASMMLLLASILLLGSLIGNPALPTGGAPAKLPGEARGVYAITRHPMLWAFTLWGGAHILVYPIAANILLAAGIILLSLVGAALQDRKKERLQPELWRAWEARTSYWPFAAIVRGQARFAGFRAHDLVGGAILWLAATWTHWPLVGLRAGLWRWIS